MTVISLIMKLVFGSLFLIIAFGVFKITTFPSGFESKFVLHKYSYTFLIIFAVLIGPFLETFTQWIPIVFMKKFSTNYVLIILVTAMIFASLHLSYGILYALVVLPSGLTLSWSFYCKYKKSLGEAFLTTFAIHSILNMISIFFIMLPLITRD